MSRMLPRLVVLALALGLGACVSTDASLRYSAPATITPAAAPVVASVSAVDQRRETANRLGTIMGGYGNPLKYLDTVRPVKDEVASVFAEGLRARGLLADGPTLPYRVALTIRKFDADQLVRRSVRIDLDLVVLDQRSGQEVYRDTLVDQRSEVQLFASGILASTDELRQMAQAMLDSSVDRMLDKPALRAALAR